MTVTIFTADGAQFPVEGDRAQDVLLILDLPKMSPWIKVRTNYGWEWIDRAQIVRVKVFEQKKIPSEGDEQISRRL